MDEKLAIGITRRHVKLSIDRTQAIEADIKSARKPLINRVGGGKALTNPVAAVGPWRALMSRCGARLVQPYGAIRASVAFRTGWSEELIDYQLLFDDEPVVDKVDQVFYRLSVLADGLAADRREVVWFSGVAPLHIDQHALARFLYRQPGLVSAEAGIAEFERRALELLPAAAMLTYVSDLEGKTDPVAVPFADGMLIGLTQHCHGTDELPAVFGSRHVATTGKIDDADMYPVGGRAPTGDERIGAVFFVGRTYLSRHELDDKQTELRDAMVAWQQRHAGAMDAMWLLMAGLGLSNKSRRPGAEIFEAAKDLGALITSDLWESAVLVPYARNWKRQWERK